MMMSILMIMSIFILDDGDEYIDHDKEYLYTG